MDLRPSSRHPVHPPERVVTLLTADGQRVSAAYDAPLPGAVDGLTIVVAHGFTGSWRRPDNRAIAQALSAHAAVVSYDARGHGRSSGATTLGDDEVLDLDAVAAWARWLGATSVATVGFSMGGSVVLRHAALTGRSTREGADAVVSVSAAGFWFYKGTAPMRLLHTAVASPVGRGILRHGFGTRVTATEWQEPYPLSPSESASLLAPLPLLVVHGDRDTYFPLEHSRSIVRAARAGAAERGVADRAEEWVERGFAHAESAATPDLVDRIGRWCTGAVGHDARGAADGAVARRSTP
ncbi:alpha/beta hydrolase [Longivirga aurantiaca]|uniref:Alpha/beta hydrolase n=1 Tax=Longivirga aurantiaca TaxID=1837743 RepID=A0ABW1SVU6_9ACTN